MKKLLANKPLVITIVAVLVLGLLALLTSGDRAMSFVESTLGSVLQPLQQASYVASDAIIDFFKRVFQTSDLDRENAELSAQLALLEQALQDYEQLQSENERLRELLNYSSTFDNTSFVAAQVIGKGQSVWFDVLTLNVGRNSGVEVGACVLTSQGLVGRVTELGATWCKVTSIIDASVSISVMNERTRDVGIVTGRLTSDDSNPSLELSYLPAGFDLVPGDVIITSGLGADLPRGIPVGVVTEVLMAGEAANQANAVVDPYVDFLHIEDVLVMITAVAEGAE
ncbi:MAG: rod shape-determining protein MreC [Clostridia bacterium]|nr:rod shape-determining protein MreC [Clostridia bacterium]